MKKYIKEMIKRKDLIVYLVMSGQKADNRDSYLGYFWWLLDPLLNVLIFYLVRVVFLNRGGGPDLPLYLAIGLVVWKWMNATISKSSRSITRYSSIINQVYLPKSIFPLATTFSEMFNFGFGLIVIAIFLIAFGVVPSWEIIFLPIIIIVQLLFLLAVSLGVAYFSVFIRDIDHLIKHIVRIFFYVSPIIWGEPSSSSATMKKFSFLRDLNPVAIIVDSYRDILMYGRLPNIVGLSIVAMGSLIIFILLIRHYSRNEHKIIKAL